jgi:hypothetical protein
MIKIALLNLLDRIPVVRNDKDLLLQLLLVFSC